MQDLKLFLGPGKYLIQPIRMNHLQKGPYIGKQKIPFGYWYVPSPFSIVRKASDMEIYIMSGYKLCKPKDDVID